MPNFAKELFDIIFGCWRGLRCHCIDCGDARPFRPLLLMETRLILQAGHVALLLDLG